MELITQAPLYYSVYMLENRSNSRKYIGQTGKHPNQRWCNGYGYRDSCPELFEDIIKEGWSSGFKRVILCTCSTREEAVNLESYYIKKYKTNISKYGYNRRCKDSCDINYDLIRNIVKSARSYEMISNPGVFRRPVKLCQKTVDKIKNNRLNRPWRGIIITAGHTNYARFISRLDIGHDWYNLPHGLIYCDTYRNSRNEVSYDLRSSIGFLSDISDKPLSPRQILYRISRNKVLQTIKQYPKLIDEYAACEKFYSENEDELSPFGITEIAIKHCHGYEPFITFRICAPITQKYLMKFLDIDDAYWVDNKLNILKMLAVKGMFERFLEFGDKIDWTL